MNISESHLAQKMIIAAENFYNSLSDNQKGMTFFNYLDGERLFWYYPPLNRHGLPLRDMDETQISLAFELLSTGLTKKSYLQAKQIINLETILGPLEKSQGKVSFKRDPALYYFTIFGTPNQNDLWGWRVEGHHISIHFSIWKNKIISMTPFFFGSNPAEVKAGPARGLRVLKEREDIAFELINSLDLSQKNIAVIYPEAPYDILTYNSSKVSLPKEEGLKVSKMNKTQKNILCKLLSEYLDQVPKALSTKKFDKLENYGIDNLFFAWGGGKESGKKHYYRIHGGDFVVEFDNYQNDANHVHSVWRDVENDFGYDILKEHLLAFHVL
jgi:hypothetical protein